MNRFTFLILLIGVYTTACGPSAPEETADAETVSPQRPWKLVCLGGSSTIGENMAPEQAYPAMLADALAQAGQRVKVVNAGIKGETIAGAEARLSWILQQRLDAFLFALGEEKADELLSEEQQKQLWQSLCTNLRNAYPEIPVFVLRLGKHEQAPSWWDELQESYQLTLLQPNWQDVFDRTLDDQETWSAEDHAALAQWLANQLHDWPTQHYQ